jgi:hypothetical protein
VKAYDRCSSIGSGFSSGVIALNANEVQSIAERTRPRSWEGTDLQYAQAVANGTFGMHFAWEGPDQVWAKDHFTRTINPNHFGPNVPAAAYYEQSDCRWWDLHEDDAPCSTITEGRYFPELVIPEKLKNLNPDWKDCKVAFGVQDPPITLPVVDKLPLPTLPTISIPGHTIDRPKEGMHIVIAPTAAPSIANPKHRDSEPILVSTSIVLGSSTFAAIYDSGTTPSKAQLLAAQQSQDRQVESQMLGPQARIVIGS